MDELNQQNIPVEMILKLQLVIWIQTMLIW